MKYFQVLLTTAIVTITLGCNSKPMNADDALTEGEVAAITASEKLTTSEGLQLLQLHCYTCHNPASTSHDDMLAPPLAGIKYNYQKAYSDRNVFIARMTDYVDNPTKENAMMKGPVRRFGLMPKTALDRDQILSVIAFIYDNKIAAPKWFPQHFEEQHSTPWHTEN